MRFFRTALLTVGVPVLICTLVGVAIHVYLARSAPHIPQTVAEAVMQRAGVRMIELIRAGADPRLPVEMSLERVAGGKPVRVTPLMLAVSRNDGDFVRLLISMGIAWSDEERYDVYCLAVVLESRFEPILGNPSFERSTCSQRMDRLGGSSSATASPFGRVPGAARVFLGGNF